MTSSSLSRLIIGCGYLGRRVARRWCAAGNTVAALTRSHQHAASLAQDGISPVIGDVLDPTSLRKLPPARTVLYAVGYDRTAPASKREVYVDGLRNVLAALPAGVEQFIYISSTSVYGQSNGEWIDEGSACEPQTDGGRICLDAEQLLRTTLDDGVSLHVLRLSGIYGPDRLIARIEALRERRELPGNPEGWLNLIHVEDAATAVVACADRQSAVEKTILVSDDRPIERRVYYETLARLIGAETPRVESTGSPHSDLGKRCSNRRLRTVLGVSLAFPTINEGLPHAVGNAAE